MIELRNAMICWCSADRWHEWKALCERCEDLPPNAARVLVVEHGSQAAHAANYLPSTLGACCADWREKPDWDLRDEMLLMFNRLTGKQEGLSHEEVHAAFMNIEEYAELYAGGRLAIVSDREAAA